MTPKKEEEQSIEEIANAVNTPDPKDEHVKGTKETEHAKKMTGIEHTNARKTKRLEIIDNVIEFCFMFLILLAVIFTADLIWFKEQIYNAPVFIVIVTIIGTTLTTAVGVVIGSSID